MVRRKQQKLSSTHCFLSVHFKHVFPTPVLECPLACLLRRAVSPQVSQLGPHEDSPVAKPRPLVSNHMRLLKKGSHVLQFVSFFFLSCYKISFLKKEQEKKQHRLRFFFSSPSSCVCTRYKIGFTSFRYSHWVCMTCRCLLSLLSLGMYDMLVYPHCHCDLLLFS